MSILQLSILALRGAGVAYAKAKNLDAAQPAIDAAAGFLLSRLVDPSGRPAEALRASVDRAWRSVEVALAGESLLNALDRAEDRAFRQHARQFLGACASHAPQMDAAFRKRALADLRAARKAGVLLVGLPAKAEADGAASFLSYTEPHRALSEEWYILGQLADGLHRGGYVDLARLVRLPNAEGMSLIVVAVRFFFRREVESDPRLFQGLVYDRLDRLGSEMEAAMANLSASMAGHLSRVESALDSLLVIAKQTHETTLDIHAELMRQGEQNRAAFEGLYNLVASMQSRLDQKDREVRPRDSFSLRSEGERRAVREILEAFHALPVSQREKLPALLNAVGKLEVAAGQFAAARSHFAKAAELVPADSARGEAHHNAYLAALEQRNFPEAVAHLKRAVSCDPERFAPFPFAKYDVVEILGAGGFGVTFKCKKRPTNWDVAIKVLFPDELQSDVTGVFREADTLRSLAHSAIVGVQDCDFADAAQTRPYMVMQYVEGVTLEDYVKDRGTLRPREFLAVFKPVAEALKAAHARGVVHRDVKPGNLLVRRTEAGFEVKVIDFGLALKTESVLGRGSSRDDSVFGGGAGTLMYAAPEQLGRLGKTPVGPYSDVYGFGRTCCYALFGTPNPSRTHWQGVAEPIAKLIDACIAEDPADRPQTFDDVLGRMSRIKVVSKADGAGPVPPPPPPKPRPEPAEAERTPPWPLYGAAAAFVSVAFTLFWSVAPQGKPFVNIFGILLFASATFAVAALVALRTWRELFLFWACVLVGVCVTVSLFAANRVESTFAGNVAAGGFVGTALMHVGLLAFAGLRWGVNRYGTRRGDSGGDLPVLEPVEPSGQGKEPEASSLRVSYYRAAVWAGVVIGWSTFFLEWEPNAAPLFAGLLFGPGLGVTAGFALRRPREFWAMALGSLALGLLFGAAVSGKSSPYPSMRPPGYDVAMGVLSVTVIAYALSVPFALGRWVWRRVAGTA